MSAQLPYRLELDNRRAVVSLLPELNEVPWADIERVGAEIIARIQGVTSPQLLVDLCALSYMGSAQVALVVRMYKLVVVEKKGKMVVANRDPMVLEVLKLSGLNKVWTIVESRERAMSMLGGGSMGGSMSGGGGGGGGDFADANPLPGTIAIIAAVAAAIFIVLHLANPALIPSRGDVFGILGGAVVAFLTGLWAMSAGNRGLGIGVVVVSVAMLLYGVFEIAKPQGSAGSPVPSEEKAAEGAAETKEGDKKADAATPAPAATPGAQPPGANPAVVDPAKAATPPADPAKAAAPKDAPAAAPKTP